MRKGLYRHRISYFEIATAHAHTQTHAMGFAMTNLEVNYKINQRHCEERRDGLCIAATWQSNYLFLRLPQPMLTHKPTQWASQ